MPVQKKPAAKSPAKPAARSAAKSRAKAPSRPVTGAPRWTLTQAMAALEKAGSDQTRKTYLRHGAKEPLFGVSFATQKDLLKRIGMDHELACALWDTGNFDARNLAVKLVDPSRMSEAELDRWARGYGARMCCAYVAAVACEGPHAISRANAWLASGDEEQRTTGWTLVGALAMRDETLPDAWFAAHLATIERTIRTVPDGVRAAMNQTVISIGCRNAALRKAALAAAKRIGPVEVDPGDTACKTPDATEYVEKTWKHSTSKGFGSPAAQERSRESMRLRC